MLIAQISDTHLRACGTPLNGFETRQALADCVAHVNALDPQPDIVLATGDLVDLGRRDDYRLLRDMLDGLVAPYFVIPGNHDRRDRLRATFVDLGYLPGEGEFLHYTVERHAIRLVALDTVIPGEVSGGMCATRLQWLADRLAERPQAPTMILMHHPPFASGIGFMDRPPFANADALAEIIGRHPQVRQVVCGHLHRAIHLNWAGTCVAVAPSTVYQMNLAFNPGEGFRPTQDPPAIALYRWEDGIGPVGFISLVLRRADGGPQ